MTRVEPGARRRAGLSSLDAVIWRAVDALLLIAVAGLLFAVTFQVVTRLIGHAAAWTEELSRFLFIWTAFLGMAAGFRRGEHPRVTVLIDLLPAPIRRGFDVLAPLAGAVLFAAVGWYAVRLVQQQIAFGETSPVLGIGMWITTLPAVLGAGLAIIGGFLAAFAPTDERPATAATAEEQP